MSERVAVVVTPRAFADVEHIRNYLLERSPAAADNVRQAIVTTLEHLSFYPRLGRTRPELGVQSIGEPRYNYTTTIG